MSNHQPLDNLFYLVHAIKRHKHEQADQLCLSIAPMHLRVMQIIDRKKSCTAVDIANFLERDKAQVTRLVSTLIEKDLVTKEPNPGDKRSHYLCITDSGAEIVKEVVKIDASTMQAMTKSLTPEELEEFQRVARIMTGNLT